MTTLGEAVAALAPVRDALLTRARSDADRLRAEAAADAARVEEEAGTEAERILTEARRRGDTDAAAVRATELVRARRAARAIVLGAQRAAYQELCRQVEAELTRRYADPGLRAALVAWVRRVLGENAVIADTPDGGVLGRLDGRRVAYTPQTQTARTIEALADTVERLWTR